MNLLAQEGWLSRSEEPRTPKNLLLACLSKDTLSAIQPYLVPCRLARGTGEVLGQDEEPPVLFPEGGVLNLLILTEGGVCPVAILGREGLANHHILFPQPRPSYQVSVQVEGDALAIEARDFRKLLGTVAAFRAVFLAFVARFELQVASTLRSSMTDTVDRRLARLLLMFRDRTDDDELHLLHSDLGEVLGVRRASITDALHRLEGRSAIRNTRGLVTFRDRRILEEIAGASYGAAEVLQRQSANSAS